MSKPIDFFAEVKRITEAHCEIMGYNKPIDHSGSDSASKPEGECVECGILTEHTDEGEFICEDCVEESIQQAREDQRLDDPRHGQCVNGKFKE